MTLTTSGSQFMLDGEPFRILSGAMHYFRVVPEYWRDRLAKMRAFGLNKPSQGFFGQNKKRA